LIKICYAKNSLYKPCFKKIERKRNFRKEVREFIKNPDKDMKPIIKYDKESNILSIRFSKKKSADSEVKGNVVIDYDENGEIVAIEIMKISLDEFLRVHREIPLKEYIKV
jgi:uncharacterized protein YuzE